MLVSIMLVFLTICPTYLTLVTLTLLSFYIQKSPVVVGGNMPLITTDRTIQPSSLSKLEKSAIAKSKITNLTTKNTDNVAAIRLNIVNHEESSKFIIKIPFATENSYCWPSSASSGTHSTLKMTIHGGLDLVKCACATGKKVPDFAPGNIEAILSPETTAETKSSVINMDSFKAKYQCFVLNSCEITTEYQIEDAKLSIVFALKDNTDNPMNLSVSLICKKFEMIMPLCNKHHVMVIGFGKTVLAQSFIPATDFSCATNVGNRIPQWYYRYTHDRLIWTFGVEALSPIYNLKYLIDGPKICKTDISVSRPLAFLSIINKTLPISICCSTFVSQIRSNIMKSIWSQLAYGVLFGVSWQSNKDAKYAWIVALHSLVNQNSSIGMLSTDIFVENANKDGLTSPIYGMACSVAISTPCWQMSDNWDMKSIMVISGETRINKKDETILINYPIFVAYLGFVIGLPRDMEFKIGIQEEFHLQHKQLSDDSKKSTLITRFVVSIGAK